MAYHQSHDMIKARQTCRPSESMSYNKPMIHCSPTQQWSCDSVVQEFSNCRFENTTIGHTIRNRQQGRTPSWITAGIGQLKCDGTRAETRFRLSAKRKSPFKSAGASVQSTTGSRGVRIRGSNAGYTMFRGSVKGTGYPRQLPLHFPSRASQCAIIFQLESSY